MESRLLRRFALAAFVIGGTMLLRVATAEARPGPNRVRRPASAFRLFQGSVNFVMQANRVQCNINNIGETCVDPTDSPVLGGGFWPAGSPDQYIFNGGLQMAGVIPTTAGFAWAGDTVGAAFFDARGRTHGEGRTNVFASTVDEDLAAWPSAAVIRDPALFDASLIGRQTIAQQDVFVRYWEGNPNRIVGRTHPAGILVDERGLAWNFPTGNQDIIYFIYRFINVSARNRAAYDGLSVAGYTTADIDEIAAIGVEFQDRNEAAFGVQIPDDGYPITNMYAAFSQDPDLGPDAGNNYSTGILPFSMGLVYKADFAEPSFAFPPSIFGPPFAAAPGFEGVKYLKSPKDPTDPLGQRELGITIFSNTTNGPPFPDPVGVSQLYRYLSGSLTPADGQCSVPFPQVRHLCASIQTAADTRFFESSGPFTLAPGGYAVIVVAYVFAAPVSAPIQNFIGGDMKPGLPLTGNLYVTPSSPADTVRDIERAAGWVSHSDADANGSIEQDEVVAVPRSLLQKSLVAQNIFDTKFLLPFAPETPLFFTVPGDNQVTLAWQTSGTEDPLTGGDPYFLVASDPTSAGYDANYRKFDVEGFRVWRGRSPATMEVLAQFDYAGTFMTDYTGYIWNSSYGSACAPDIGVVASCPDGITFAPGETVDHALAGEIIQVRPGGYTPLANGNVLIVDADTAVVGGASGFTGLVDNLVPFVYVDNTARNGFRYYYAVTAFDINSVASGPTSLESPLAPKAVTPRPAATTVTNAVLVSEALLGDGSTLDPTLPFPTIDAANGTFSGPIPPTNGATFSLLAAVAEALPVGNFDLRVDSVSAGFSNHVFDPPPYFHASLVTPTDTVRISGEAVQPDFSASAVTLGSFFVTGPLIPYDSARSRQLGIAFTQDTRMPVKLELQTRNIGMTSNGIALNLGRFFPGTRFPSRFLAHSRWFDEGGSEPPDPTISQYADAAHHAGKLTGVTRIYSPSAYRQPKEGEAAPANTAVRTRFRNFDYAQAAWYPADFVVTWGAGGTAVVRDSTHRVNLPATGGLGTGYGFVNAAAYAAAGVTGANMASADGGAVAGITYDPTVVGYRHLYFINPVCVSRGRACIEMGSTAQLEPLDLNNDGVQDGTGIVIVVNGEPFFMEMAALPAAGTKWHLRAVGGRTMNATCTPPLDTLGTVITDCDGYTFAEANPNRPAYVPGLTFRIRVTQGFELAQTSGDISRIHTVPDPYYVTNQLEITSNTKVLRFVNLPDRAIIRIYSVSGILVNIISHNDQTGGGEQTWNLRNRNNQFVASGVYFYHVETPDGQTKIGRFTVVNFAQ